MRRALLDSASIITAAQRRKGAVGSPCRSGRLIGDALATTTRLDGLDRARILVHADSAYNDHDAISATTTDRADVSVIVQLDARVRDHLLSFNLPLAAPNGHLVVTPETNMGFP